MLKKVRHKNLAGPKFVFYDGPITANNPMGVHHAWGRTYKDVVQRFKSMQGFNQRFQNGFDTQGLWLEVEVERSLNLGTKRDILNFGLVNFVQSCKERISKFSSLQTRQSKELGQMMDWENSYFTHTDANIETIWHFLKVCNQRGWLYRGHRTMPWCWRCGTSLSKHEQMDSYTDMSHTSVYVKFPLVDESMSLLVWTTTPWTLPANVAVGVHPDLEYGLFEKGGDMLYAGLWMEPKLKGYQLVKRLKGLELEGKKYSYPFDTDFGRMERKVFLWDEVTADEGTGLVHLAPGCGEEDFKFSQQNGLSVIRALDEEGKYLHGFGNYSSHFYQEVNEMVISDLEKAGNLFGTENYFHRYPVCWRCKEELVFRLVDEWFIRCDEVREMLREASIQVTWNPPKVGTQFNNWLNNMSDWCISRKRFWGLPLPFYPCKCGHVTVVGSVNELMESALVPIDLPELHKPWIDKVQIKCEQCGNSVSRVPDVGDCWLDAGIMPFSTLNYLKDKEYWKDWFPADFVCEMREQVRLWFYSMMFMSVTLEGRAPFKYVLAYEAVKDKFGNPFHKTGPNAIILDEVLESMGADALRFLYMAQNNSLPLRFDPHSTRGNKVLRSFYNATKFLVMYAELDGLDANLPTLSEPLDIWMAEELDAYLSTAEQAYETYDFPRLVEETEQFLDWFTNWYIRLSRKEIWEGNSVKRALMFKTLTSLAKVLAPLLPFVTELVHLRLRTYDKTLRESVHLESFPKSEGYYSGWRSPMRNLRRLAEMGRKLREQVGLKTRHPLPKALVWAPERDKTLMQLLPLLEQELNVKSVRFLEKPDWYLKYRLVPNYQVAGPLLGKELDAFKTALQTLPKKKVLMLKNGKDVVVQFGNRSYRLTKDLVHLEFETRKGFVSEVEDNLAIFLDTKQPPAMKQEGLVRDVIRQVQMERQNKGLKITQNIRLHISAPPEVINAIRAFETLLKTETLCTGLEMTESSRETDIKIQLVSKPLAT